MTGDRNIMQAMMEILEGLGYFTEDYRRGPYSWKSCFSESKGVCPLDLHVRSEKEVNFDPDQGFAFVQPQLQEKEDMKTK